jgi:hypothetical protein
MPIIRVFRLKRRGATTVGMALFILGCSVVLICWIPFWSLFSWPLVGLSALVGIIGLIIAARSRQQHYAPLISGAATGLVAIAMSLMVTEIVEILLGGASSARPSIPPQDTRQAARPQDPSVAPHVAKAGLGPPSTPDPIRPAPEKPHEPKKRPPVAPPPRQSTEEDEFRAKVAKLDLTLERRKRIVDEVYAAEDRAQWEADRYYDSVDQFREHLAYFEKNSEEYRKDVAHKNALTYENLKLLMDEALIEDWPHPEYPACDVEEIAKKTPVTVYADKGTLTYHRRGCPLLGRDGPTVKLSIYKAITTNGSKACGHCNP